MENDVVATGAGIACSLGLSRSEIRDALRAGKSGIREVEEFDRGGVRIHAARVKGLEQIETGVHPKLARMMGVNLSMLMKCAGDALEQCDRAGGDILPEEIGFFAGMGVVDYNVEDLLPAVLKSRNTEGSFDPEAFYSFGYRNIYPLWPLSTLNNIVLCGVAIAFDIRGENCVFSPHADSGISALAEAAHCVREGKVRLALAAGVGERFCPNSFARACLTGILNEEEGDRRIPSSAGSAGAGLGEGCGVISLETSSSAKKRSVRPVARIAGFGFSCAGEKGPGYPDAEDISKAMRAALDDAGLNPSDIDILFAHDDGAIPGSLREAEAIRAVFGDSFGTRVFSSKRVLGNMLAASPLVDVILGADILLTGIVPFAPGNASAFDHEWGGSSGASLKTPFRRVMITALSHEGRSASMILESVDER